MKPTVRKIVLFVASFLCCGLMTGKPAIKGFFTLTQPDGTEFRAVLHGDEFSRILKDAGGHAIMLDSDGWYCYAAFNPDGSRYSSGYVVGEKAPAYVLDASMAVPEAALKMLSANLRRPADLERLAVRIGDSKAVGPVEKACPVILAQFSDLSMSHTASDFNALVCGRGYTAGGATGSVLEYLEEQFRDDYIFNFKVSPIVTLSRPYSYYGANDSKGRDAHLGEAVEEACRKAAEAGFDFSRFDGDGDGSVDNVFVFFAGKDEADGAGDDFIWSQQYYLRYMDRAMTIDGKVIDCFTVAAEMAVRDNGRFGFTGIGTFCHEYSHSLGLMDMYDTDGTGSGGMGDGLWYTTALMDGGSRNNSSNTPPHYNAIDYDCLGIGSPEILAAGEYKLEPISENRRYLRFEGSNPGEYYLIECRDNNGWDRYIGGSGLAIYHIDKSKRPAGMSDYYMRALTAAERWEANQVNCRPEMQCARFVPAWPEARAFDSNGNYVGNPSVVFFPYGDKDAFTSETSPSFSFWSGEKSSLAITGIRRSGDGVEFRVVNIGGVDFPEVRITSSDIFQNTAIISWERTEGDYNGSSYVSWGQSDGNMTTVEVKPYAAGRYAIRLHGLTPRTAYKFSVCFGNEIVKGREVSANFTTGSQYKGYPFIYLNGVDRNSDGSFRRGARLPLVVYNVHDSYGVDWFFDGRKVEPASSGYYIVESSGELRAEIHGADGSTDVLYKEIIVK